MVTFGGAVSYSELQDMPIPELMKLKRLMDRVIKLRGTS